MCGILGIIGTKVPSLLQTGLAALQHRGQDSAGVYLSDGTLYKSMGTVEKVLTDEVVEKLGGTAGIGQVRYATVKKTQSIKNAQPFEVKNPLTVSLVHNGNLTNTDTLHSELNIEEEMIDSELLLQAVRSFLPAGEITPERLFDAVNKTHKILTGSYSVILLIPEHGMLAFRDPRGIRPLVMGRKQDVVVFASESRVFDILGFSFERDVEPGEAIFVKIDGTIHTAKHSDTTQKTPCMFEYIYLCRPDSVFEEVPVYDVRVELGRQCGKYIQEKKNIPYDIIVPVPDTGCAIADGFIEEMPLPYHNILVRNRNIKRTFIMDNDTDRQFSLRQKFSIVQSQVKGKSVCFIDDSIVRGNTAKVLTERVRSIGAKEVHFISASPPVLFPNHYGIQIADTDELVAHNRTEKEVAEYIGADSVTYLPIELVRRAIQKHNPNLKRFEESIFTGVV